MKHERGWPRDDWSTPPGAYVFAGVVYGMLGALMIVLLCGGCMRQAAPTMPAVLPVAITAWPAPIKPDCELSDLPQVPDVFVWTQISDEQSQRIYITQRQLADLVVWLKDVQQWSGLVTRCLEKLAKP